MWSIFLRTPNPVWLFNSFSRCQSDHIIGAFCSSISPETKIWFSKPIPWKNFTTCFTFCFTKITKKFDLKWKNHYFHNKRPSLLGLPSHRRHPSTCYPDFRRNPIHDGLKRKDCYWVQDFLLFLRFFEFLRFSVVSWNRDKTSFRFARRETNMSHTHIGRRTTFCFYISQRERQEKETKNIALFI